MTGNDLGQMMWKRELDGDRHLYLRRGQVDEWRHYQSCPEYAVEDPPHFSLGYATFMNLLKKGWVAVSEN
jgi:hypothetical protein